MASVNPPDGGKWTDDRISDLAMTVWATRDIPQRIAVLENAQQSMVDDLHGCKQGIDKLHEIRSDERKEREAERARRDAERKSDRKWLIGTALTTVGLVIAALAVFLA